MSFHFYSSQMSQLSRTRLSASTLILLLKYQFSFAFPVIPKANCDIFSNPYTHSKYIYLSHCNCNVHWCQIFSHLLLMTDIFFLPVQYLSQILIPGSSTLLLHCSVKLRIGPLIRRRFQSLPMMPRQLRLNWKHLLVELGSQDKGAW